MTRKYISRDFTNHQKTIEYLSDSDEYIKFEIFSFDQKHTKTFVVGSNTLTGENAVKTTFKGDSCLQSKDKIDPLEFTLNYTVKEAGLYRIDVLYEQNSNLYSDSTFNTHKDLTGWYDLYLANSKQEHKAVVHQLKTIDPKFPKSVNNTLNKMINNSLLNIANSSKTDRPVSSKTLKFDGEDDVLKRKTLFHQLNTGNYKIEFGVPHNCVVYGAIIRKVLTFYGTNNDEAGSQLQFTDAKLTISEMMKSAELEVTVGYDSSFECDTSPSGLYMEYMDECNLYVKDNEGNIVRVFGGYVSTPLPDSSMEELTIHCADRVKDGENRYILNKLVLQKGDTSQSESEYIENDTISFNRYGAVLEYLCQLYEVTLNNNISKNTVVGEKFGGGWVLTFGKNKDVKKVPVTNGQVTINKNSITLRNNSSGLKKQVWTLYQAKKPVDISNTSIYDTLQIKYGLGDVKTEHKVKETIGVDVAGATAGSQKFGKCGKSQDKKYVMAIGKPSAKNKQAGVSNNQIYKTIFKNYCPECKHEGTLVWDSGRSDTNCVYCGGYKGSKRSWGNISETEITCTHCCSDFDAVTGLEKNKAHSTRLTKISRVKSSKAEQNKLHKGEMVAVPSNKIKLSADDIFKAIRNACKGWTHQTNTGTTASYLEKHGKGDCWAWSDWIGKQLKKYKVNYKIVEYVSTGSKQHRSVLYQNSKGKYVDFPYKQYNFPKGTYNTKGSTNGSVRGKYTKGGRISQAVTTTSTSKSQTNEVTVTNGYDKDNPFQCYIDITYSTINSTNAKKYHIYVDFTQQSTSNHSLTGLKPVWVNNTIKEVSLENVVTKIKAFRNTNTVYLHSISLITPKIKITNDKQKSEWYTNDKSTKDNSSCKMKLYSIEFNVEKNIPPRNLDATGKTINEKMREIVEDAGYIMNMSYGLHRCDDKINFHINDTNTQVFTATEGDNNNILEWGNISFNPANELFNNSQVVFKKKSTDKYFYVESKNIESILKYQEQSTLITENEAIGEKEAYWNARHNEKYNPVQTYNFTITVKGFPNLHLKDFVEVIANMKKLNTLKEVESIILEYHNTDKPVLQTELGLGELSPDIQVNKTIKQLRDKVKKSTTYFEGTATAIRDENIYEWEN